MYNSLKIKREFELTDLFVEFKVQSSKPTFEEMKAIDDFFEQDLSIKKGTLMKTSKATCWIVGDAENPEWLTRKFADYEQLIERIEPGDPVLFLGVVTCGIKKNVHERTPIYQLSKRKKSNDDKLDWFYLMKIITREGKIGYFILPFYELDEKIKVALGQLFSATTSTT